MSHWELSPLQIVPVLLYGVAYAMRVWQLADRGRRVAGARQAAFYAGLLVAALALVSPLDYLGEHRSSAAHMAQHLLLGEVAPLLVVLGLAGPLLRPLLAVRWVRGLRFLGHPLVAIPVWAVDLYAWICPSYQAALHHAAVHGLEHLCFFAGGALMWAAVIEPLPGPVWFGGGWKAIHVPAVRASGAILANVFIWGTQPFYSFYVTRERSPLADQRLAGAIMFIEGGVLTLLAFASLFLGFTRETELRQRLLDRDPATSAPPASPATAGRPESATGAEAASRPGHRRRRHSLGLLLLVVDPVRGL